MAVSLQARPGYRPAPAQEALAPPGGVDPRGGERAVGSHGGHAVADGTAALRHRDAFDGMRSLAGEGCGVLSPRDRRARRQGRQGPDDDAAGVVGPKNYGVRHDYFPTQTL